MTVFVSSRRTPGKPNTKHTPRTDWSIGVIVILYIYYLQRVENASPYKWLEAGISVLHGVTAEPQRSYGCTNTDRRARLQGYGR